MSQPLEESARGGESAHGGPSAASPRAWAVLAALPGELGGLCAFKVGRRRMLGLELFELDLDGRPVLACAGGIGKVLAARAAAALLAASEPEALLVVGTCGALRAGLVPGAMVHCATAFQTDLAVRDARRAEADARLRAAWRALVPGPQGWFLTSDRPVLSAWRRLRLARAFAGPCVADMETAAAAVVAERAGVPWAALRAVTDGAGALAALAFRRNYPTQAGRAADSVRALSARLREPRPPTPERS